jgi:hypothetical protein
MQENPGLVCGLPVAGIEFERLLIGAKRFVRSLQIDQDVAQISP